MVTSQADQPKVASNAPQDHRSGVKMARTNAGTWRGLAAMLCVAAMSVAALGGEAQAQSAVGTNDENPAESLFRRGKEAARERDWQRAFSLFERSFLRHPSYDTAANLGQVALKLKRHADAADYLSYSLEHFPPSEALSRREAIASMRAIALEKIGVVEVTVLPAGAELTLDGEPVRSTQSLRWFLAPGRHVVVAQFEGYETHQQEVLVRPKTTHELAIELRRLQATSGDDREPAATANSVAADWREPLPILLVGGGISVTALAVGLGFSLAADSKESLAKSRASELPDSNPSLCAAFGGNLKDCAELGQLSNEADSRRSIAYVGFGVASVAVVGTAVLLLWPRRSAAAIGTPLLTVGQNSGSLLLRGRF